MVISRIEDDFEHAELGPRKRQRREIEGKDGQHEPHISNSSNILRILDRDAAYDALFAHCTPATLHRLSLSCRISRRAVSDYNSRAYDINKHFSRFFRNPVAFRRLQMYTGAVVSGSNALQFLDRAVYPEADLDIYVHKDSAERVGKWIMDAPLNESGESSNGPGAMMGYKFAPRENQLPEFSAAFSKMLHGQFHSEHVHPEELEHPDAMPYPDAGISGVFSFITNDRRGRKLNVQLIVCYHLAIRTILEFHSSEFLSVLSYALSCFLTASNQRLS